MEKRSIAPLHGDSLAGECRADKRNGPGSNSNTSSKSLLSPFTLAAEFFLVYLAKREKGDTDHHVLFSLRSLPYPFSPY